MTCPRCLGNINKQLVCALCRWEWPRELPMMSEEWQALRKPWEDKNTGKLIHEQRARRVRELIGG